MLSPVRRLNSPMRRRPSPVIAPTIRVAGGPVHDLYRTCTGAAESSGVARMGAARSSPDRSRRPTTGRASMSFNLAAVEVGDSIQGALDSLFAFLPKLLGFLVVLAIGWIVAKVVKTVVTKALQGVGLDRALHSGTTGQYVHRVAPNTSPSGLIGLLAFWFIFLGALGIAVSQLGIALLDNFVAAIASYLP